MIIICCFLYYCTCMSHYNRHQKSSHTLWLFHYMYTVFCTTIHVCPITIGIKRVPIHYDRCHYRYTVHTLKGKVVIVHQLWSEQCTVKRQNGATMTPIFRPPSLMIVWIGVLFCLLSPKLFIKWHHGDRTVHTRCIILLAPTFPCINKMFKLRLHSGLLTLDCQLPSVVSHTNSLPSIWVLNWVL